MSTEITPERALVKPRVLSSATGETLLLEDVIETHLSRGDRGLITITGSFGSGKTTALRHLVALFGSEPGVSLIDLSVFDPVPHFTLDSLTIISLEQQYSGTIDALGTYRMSPWGKDELIEYLLAVHPDRCQPVLSRWQDAPDRTLSGLLPELCRIVWEQMARDETITTVRKALHSVLHSHLRDETVLKVVQRHSYQLLIGQSENLLKTRIELEQLDCDENILRLLRHNPILVILTAAYVADTLGFHNFKILERRMPPELINEIALTGGLRLVDPLHRVVAGDSTKRHAMAASIFKALDINWKPVRDKSLPDLRGAYLDHVQWREVDLAKGFLDGTDFENADLTGANLDGAASRKTNLNGASLRGASLKGLFALSCSLINADLSSVIGDKAVFLDANCQGADFSDALLRDVNFERADLSTTSFRGADLSGSVLTSAQIKNADFSDSDLSLAYLKGTVLYQANFSGARFSHADLTGCNMESMELPDANFASATLRNAYLTGTRMLKANFQKADLRNTGLAEIDWEGADLRDADLRYCTFHLGSSRSGLVDSPIASEGTRTGFYTDDYEEQHFKSPEQIRKANLRGVDLRGAKIDGVDFYLVDLRDAIYTEEHRVQFERTGAILESLV